MFSAGEYIVYGINGICRVESVGPSPYNKEDTRAFYRLVPAYNPMESVIYTPVENEHIPMRRLMTEAELAALLEKVPQIAELSVPVEKQRRDVYRAAIGEIRPEGFVSVIKTVRRRREELTAQHKHFPVTDLEYGRLAKHLLFSECAHVMGISEEDAEAYFERSFLEAN